MKIYVIDVKNVYNDLIYSLYKIYYYYIFFLSNLEKKDFLLKNNFILYMIYVII